MTTSSDNLLPSAPRPEAKNWHEIASTFAPNATEKFSDWIDEQLRALEVSQCRFVTRQGLVKSLRR